MHAYICACSVYPWRTVRPCSVPVPDLTCTGSFFWNLQKDIGEWFSKILKYQCIVFFVSWLYSAEIIRYFSIYRLQLKRGLFWYRHYPKLHQMVKYGSSRALVRTIRRQITLRVYFTSFFRTPTAQSPPPRPALKLLLLFFNVFFVLTCSRLLMLCFDTFL